MVRPDRDEHSRATAAGIHGTSGGNFPEKERAQVVEVGHWQVARGKLVCELSSDTSGRPIGAVDAFFAGNAQNHRLTLVTGMFPTSHCSRPFSILGQTQGPRADSWCVLLHSRDLGPGLEISNCGKAPKAGYPRGGLRASCHSSASPGGS